MGEIEHDNLLNAFDKEIADTKAVILYLGNELEKAEKHLKAAERDRFKAVLAPKQPTPQDITKKERGR